MNNYPHHPAADKYPMMDGEAYKAFKEDIRVNGQRLSIYVQNGEIVDGRNRQKACQELGIPAIYEEIEGDPYDLAESLNLHRRHLTKDQRQDLILKKRAEGKSTRQIAEEVGVSKDTVARTVANETVDLPTEITGKDGKKRKARKTECDQKIVELAQAGLGTTAISKQAGIPRGTVRAKLEQMALDTIQSEVDALPAQCEEAKHELSLTAQQKLERAISLFEQQKLAEMQREFQVELAAAVAAKQEQLDALIESRRQEEHAAKQLRQQLMDARATVDRIMTYEEFKIVRGLLHPDRYPDELKERAGKAFDIFNRLEKCVNPNIGITELRKRGWEHLSPYGRRKSA